MEVTDIFNNEQINTIIKNLEDPKCEQFLQENNFNDLLDYIQNNYIAMASDYIAFLELIGISVVNGIDTLYSYSIRASRSRLTGFMNELYGVSKDTVDLTFPEHITKFRQEAANLYGVRIETIHLPKSTKYVEKHAFICLPKNVKIYIPMSAKYYKTSFTISGNGVGVDKNQIIKY